MELDDDLQSFDEAEVDRLYPNARRFFTGSLFVCHAGADFRRILELIAHPVLMDRYGDGYFLHNRKSGGSEAYKMVVSAALHWCDTYMLVASRNTEGHKWVRPELDWLFRNNRSVIVCLLEDFRAELVHPRLPEVLMSRLGLRRKGIVVDFRTNSTRAQTELGRILDRQLSIRPYPRFLSGPP